MILMLILLSLWVHAWSLMISIPHHGFTKALMAFIWVLQTMDTVFLASLYPVLVMCVEMALFRGILVLITKPNCPNIRLEAVVTLVKRAVKAMHSDDLRKQNFTNSHTR